MYIAMNHFRVTAGRAEEFERAWRERDSYLEQVPGFVEFHLLRGKDEDDGTHAFASHTIWRDHQAFLDWAHSEEFKKAHAKGSTSGLLREHPRFRGWQAVDLG